MTRTFETVTEAKNFAQTKLDEGLTVFAGTLNPCRDKSFIRAVFRPGSKAKN